MMSKELYCEGCGEILNDKVVQNAGFLCNRCITADMKMMSERIDELEKGLRVERNRRMANMRVTQALIRETKVYEDEWDDE